MQKIISSDQIMFYVKLYFDPIMGFEFQLLRSVKCLSGEMVSAPISSKFEIFHNSIFSQCERVFQKLKFKTHYWVKIKFYVKYDLVRGDDFLHPAFVPNLGSLFAENN